MVKSIKLVRKYISLQVLLLVGACAFLLQATTLVAPSRVSAQPANTPKYECTAEQLAHPSAGSPCIPPNSSPEAIRTEAQKKINQQACAERNDCGSLISNYLNPFVRTLTALVGIVIAISLVAAGIQYGSAGGDPSKVAAAKKRISGAIVALIAYLFAFGLIQWLVPGGLI